MKDVQLAKNQNRISKEQFELLSKRAANNSIEHIAEIELKLDEMKLENKQLNKQIQNLKKEQNSKKKVLEKYSTNKKYPQEIKSYTDEVKTLSLKKRDYYLKLLNNKKSLNHCLTQLESVDNLYNEYKEKKNYSHHKVEQELTKLKMDLKGNENEIWDKVEKGMTIIVKQADDNNYNLLNNPNIRKTPKLLKPLNAKIANKDIQRGNYNYNFSKRSSKSSGRKVNIVAQNKNEDIDLSKITYDTLSDYGYNDLLTKKEHYVDINLKLERSIKETKKMYERKVKEHVALVEQNKQKLNYLEQENELLVSEISDLQKLIEITEEEERVKNEVNQNQFNNNNINHQISAVRHPNKEHTNNINDVSETRNDILNDLKELNASATEKNKTKFAASALEEEDVENKAIKFEDISNVEHVDVSKEINRSKVIDELKKKYNIGMKTNEEGKGSSEFEQVAQQNNLIEGVVDKEENEKEYNDNQNEEQDEDEGEEKQQENEEQKEEEQEDDNVKPPNDEGNEGDNIKETDINQSHLVEQEEKKEEGDVHGGEEKEEEDDGEEKEDDKEEHEQSQEENKEDEQIQQEEENQQPVQDMKEQIHVEPQPEHLHFEKKIIRVEQHENKKDPNSAEFFEKDKQVTTIQNNDEQEINNEEQQNEVNSNKEENNQEQNDNDEEEEENEEENKEEHKDNEQDLEEHKEEPNEDNNQHEEEEEENNDNVNNEEEGDNEDSLEQQQHNEQENNESQDSLDQPNNNEQDDDINNNNDDNDSINKEIEE